MEIMGGFMVMLGILGFFLAVIWFILPFVIFSIKGKVDRGLLLLEDMDRRLKAIEERYGAGSPPQGETGPSAQASSPDTPPS